MPLLNPETLKWVCHDVSSLHPEFPELGVVTYVRFPTAMQSVYVDLQSRHSDQVVNERGGTPKLCESACKIVPLGWVISV